MAGTLAEQLGNILVERLERINPELAEIFGHYVSLTLYACHPDPTEHTSDVIAGTFTAASHLYAELGGRFFTADTISPARPWRRGPNGGGQ